MSFSLTLPEDNALVLNAMSRALAEIAQGVPLHGTAPMTVTNGELNHTKNEPVQQTPVEDDDTSERDLALFIKEIKRDDVDPVPNEIRDNHNDSNDITNNDDIPLPDLDKNGLPWDKRINSTPASLTGANEWKMRRKPKDMDDAQWVEYIKTVRNELTNLMNIEVESDVIDSDNVEPVVSDNLVVNSVEVIPPPVTPDTVFSTEPVAPPVAPPTINPSITTFPQLMTWLTGMTGKITVEQVNGALVEWNMNSVALLAKRPDLIPPFVTKIEELLK